MRTRLPLGCGLAGAAVGFVLWFLWGFVVGVSDDYGWYQRAVQVQNERLIELVLGGGVVGLVLGLVVAPRDRREP